MWKYCKDCSHAVVCRYPHDGIACRHYVEKENRGYWKSEEDGSHYCSSCGREATFTYDGEEVYGVACPNCGAKMTE